MEKEKKARATGAPIPLDIISELEDNTYSQMQANFARFRKEVQKYSDEKWLKPERINLPLTADLQNYKVDTQKVIKTINKHAEYTRFQAAVGIDIYERLQFALEEASDVQEVKQIMEQCSITAKRLAVYGLFTAQQQDKDAKKYSDAAIHIPVSAQHIDAEANDKYRDAYSPEFLSTYFRAKHEEKMEYVATSDFRGRGGNGYVRPRGNYYNSG